MEHDVTFTSEGTEIRARLYLPDGEGPFPAVVMAGGWCYVKELVQPDYAKVFVRAGLAALIFDYRHLGESGESRVNTSTPGVRSRTTRTPSPTSRPGPRSMPGESRSGGSPTAAGMC